MEIRDATAGDLPAIVEIYNSTIPSRIVSADTEPISVEDRVAWFRAHDPSRRPLWVMEDEGEIVGWLSLGDFYDGRPAYHATAEVGIYVAQKRRGEGLGRRLVEEALSRAPGLGIKTLTAGIFAHNEASVALFEGFGFEAWARFPRVADLDGIERDLLVLGLRVDD
ncbi:GNAT family N-acetyltransferase [Rubrobacter tropicus]|uniref:GNAT family N-acetyltransferase n=1 Tax=Rubrobacter tropicus TaxID=2653851 RepID=A0A6G8QFR2_9ACTN|nr:GNAT family N-acetyltransferase [Rubrobacter tropicus]QIN85241.1 GNAT family N-acetyltransferase [Rubrobacter tropicus]